MTPTTSVKIIEIIEQRVLLHLEKWKELLICGELSHVENQLQLLIVDLYNEIMTHLLQEVGRSITLKKRLEILGLSLGLSCLKLRTTRIQIGTGHWVKYRSYYAHQVVDQDSVSINRQLSQVYWGCVDRASPRYLSTVSMMSVISPSYELAGRLLIHQSIECNYNRMRRLSLACGAIGQELGISAQLDEGENMVGKRVVIQIDGGRSRMRENKAERSTKGFKKYDTPWREPKLIVIHVLDEKGQLARQISKPLYQAAIQDAAACMKDLVDTLRLLQVDQAKEVQFLADGAKFIWSRIRAAFKKAGVRASKITYTLDYYHAVEHLKELCEYLPLGKEERHKQFNQWKNCLWEGFANSIAREFKKKIHQAGLKLSQAMQTACNYFTRHHDRMQYKLFKRRKLLCGSGLVESAIRRVINLRFKGPSTFWCAENLDKMYLLRCALLSDRWDNLMKAIELKIKTGGTI